MTTTKELGEMLITGKLMQERKSHAGCWVDMVENIKNFHLKTHYYRLKPTTTYYRVWVGESGRINTSKDGEPHPSLSSFLPVGATHIHDFQIEE